ncbi:hypothetical protein KJ815_00970, partial [bacterium]|nr:hypothetical protein [bacterium]
MNRFYLAVVVVLALAGLAHSQAWDATTTFQMGGFCAADNICYPDPSNPDWGTPVTNAYQQLGLVPGILGFDLLAFRAVEANENTYAGHPCGYTYAQAKCAGLGIVDGIGTPEVLICWGINDRAEGDPEMFATRGIDSLDISVVLDVTGLPPGTPIIIYYSWDHYGGIGGDHETQPPSTPFEDSCRATGTLNISGKPEQFRGRFDYYSPPFGLWGTNRRQNQTDTLMRTVGDQITVTVSLRTASHANHLWPWTDLDKSTASEWGQIRLRIGSPPTPTPPDSLYTSWLEFSQDIGADAELSDPNVSGNERFDPGDAYQWQGPPLPPGGTDGIRDDQVLFGHDPFPAVPDLAVPPATRAPVGSGLPPDSLRDLYFDLDGHDNLELDIRDHISGPGYPSIPPFPSHCIHGGEYLFISFDDDLAPHYTTGAVPVGSASPWTALIYGKSSTTDEVIGLNVFPFAPGVVYFQYPYLTEGGVHQSLLPNPDGGESEDDDVDALDICDDECGFWYLSVDHEATYGLDPGVIYIALSSGPVPVVSQVHLGTIDGTDIDAFEFVWIWDESAQRNGLALLFSVDDDD